VFEDDPEPFLLELVHNVVCILAVVGPVNGSEDECNSGLRCFLDVWTQFGPILVRFSYPNSEYPGSSVESVPLGFGCLGEDQTESNNKSQGTEKARTKKRYIPGETNLLLSGPLFS
jgi:hypothetical protein